MKVFRIARKAFIEDLTGEGARLYGGRWNRKGSPVVYTSGSRSLAVLEYLVHTSLTLLPDDLCMAEIEVPDTAGLLETIALPDLPEGWRRTPSPYVLADLGEQWRKQRSTLLLRVPSAVIPEEWNYVINPQHPAIAEVRLLKIEEKPIDLRLA